jgi:hypothetical protein
MDCKGKVISPAQGQPSFPSQSASHCPMQQQRGTATPAYALQQSNHNTHAGACSMCMCFADALPQQAKHALIRVSVLSPLPSSVLQGVGLNRAQLHQKSYTSLSTFNPSLVSPLKLQDHERLHGFMPLHCLAPHHLLQPLFLPAPPSPIIPWDHKSSLTLLTAAAGSLFWSRDDTAHPVTAPGNGYRQQDLRSCCCITAYTG